MLFQFGTERSTNRRHCPGIPTQRRLVRGWRLHESLKTISPRRSTFAELRGLIGYPGCDLLQETTVP